MPRIAATLRKALAAAAVLGWAAPAAVLGWAAPVAGTAEPEDRCEIGGPLAGLKLPPFPTQFGEPAGYPGCLPDPTSPGKLLHDKEGLSPELHLHAESVEHWRANDFKYVPARSLYDRQTLLRNWKAPELAGGEGRTEPYAEPLYWVRRHEDPKRLDKSARPVAVVRCKPRAPVMSLDCEELGEGMYVLSVVGAVEAKDLASHRKALYVKLAVNDGPAGEQSTYRMRLGYCDQFYSVAEIYFHAPQKRRYEAKLWVDDGSAVDLLIHNVELHDVLAGRIRSAIKKRVTTHDPSKLPAALAAGKAWIEERLK
jgi:hypothetical protein